jgi:hypothetical protein
MSTKPLSRIKVSSLYWLDSDGTKHEGNCSNLSGNCSNLSGDCSGIPSEVRPCALADWIEEP